MFSYKKIALMLSTTLLMIGFVGHVHATPPDGSGDKAAKEAVENKDNEFPGRKRYAHVPYITIEQLSSEYDNTIIVDSRSAFEFETLRILSAVNVPLSLSNSKYTKQLRELRENHPDKKIVFYCNGHTCMKSYKAAHKAKVIAKLDNVLAFDAGIFDWAKAHPDKAILLEKTPINLADLISGARYKQHLLSPIDFINKSSGDTIILDVRSRNQREGIALFSGYETTVSMGDKSKLNKYIQQAKNENKKLFIYDAVGKQVRWLQYYLEEQKAGEYYFMEGGAEAYYKHLMNNYYKRS